MEELRLQEMALMSRQQTRLFDEYGMLGINVEGEVHLKKEGFKKLFPTWKEEDHGEYIHCIAEAYGVKFFALERKVKS